MLDFLGTQQRTHTCGEMRAQHASETVTLMGWVNRRRDHGNLIFLDLRDRSGIAQIVLDKDKTPDGHAKGELIRPEYVVAVTGKVRLRAANVINPKMPTGEVEIVADQVLVLNDSKLPPFSPAEDSIDNEEVRLKYRFLDLRRPEMQRNLMLRHDITLAIRQYLSSEGFLEIETPILTRSTPEGARDYLVPSRVHAGEFFALPQSPQIFKQILMISGLDRYFQIARCFRDEDLRADRQPEFTQVDLEMSFPQQESIHRVTEGFLAAAFRVAGTELSLPFPRMTFDDAIRQYGIDKPDLRLPALTEVSAAFAPENLATLGIAAGLPLVAVRTPGVGELSRKERDDLRLVYPPKLAQNNVKVYDDFKRLEKSFPEAIARIRSLTGAEPNDYIVLVGADGGADGAAAVGATSVQFGDGVEGQRPPSGDESGGSDRTGVGTAGNVSAGVLTGRERTIFEMAGLVRLALAAKFADRHKAFEKKGNSDDYKFLWVTDFPFFEYDDEKRAWTFAHHPFTSPHEDDLRAGRMESDPGSVRALAYDVVLNGTELGSGSIRIHRQDVQQQIFRSLGMTAEETKARFGFFLEALEFGTPPHGGIALGLDRIAMILAGAQSLREVIAFPKTAKAIDLMMDAPTTVSESQLRELHIRTVLKG